MKSLTRALIGVATLGCIVVPLRASAAAADASEIMKQVDDSYRKAFLTAVAKVQLSTCKYVTKNEGLSCKEKPRVTVLEVGEKKWGGDNKDSRAIALVLQPVTDKGVGLLTYEYFAADRDNDVLLYLPELKKIRRVVSGGGNEDGGSFFGTEFFSDDVQLKKVHEFTYSLLREEAQDDRQCWVIESVPTAARAKKTAYGKSVMWIDKDRKLILREDIYNRAGKLYRQRLNKDFVQIDNVWIARQQTMNNLSSNRITAIQNLSVTYNKDVPDELVTERSLTDFTFRERTLTALRTFYK